MASDPARLRDQPPPRLTVFGFEAITLLELAAMRGHRGARKYVGKAYLRAGQRAKALQAYRQY
ncbi:MAG: hypothetical protein QGI33_05395, partial [Candidatus Brocadiia bacterium]|nr:hypothetical protein [Candidatus Brocadiia bacterium]